MKLLCHYICLISYTNILQSYDYLVLTSKSRILLERPYKIDFMLTCPKNASVTNSWSNGHINNRV